MKTITRDTEGNLSEPIPERSLRNVWNGDTCTVYEPGDEALLPLAPIINPDEEAAE